MKLIRFREALTWNLPMLPRNRRLVRDRRGTRAVVPVSWLEVETFAVTLQSVTRL